MQQSTIEAPDVGKTSAKVSPGKGLLVLGLVVAVVGSFIALTHALQVADAWIAFLFLLYWAGIEQMDFKKLPYCAVGAAAGLLAAYALRVLPETMGSVGGVICLAGILLMIYCQIMGWFLVVINMVTMLFLTVGTIPLIQANADFPRLFWALLLGIIFFPGLAWIAKLVATQRAAAKAAA